MTLGGVVNEGDNKWHANKNDQVWGYGLRNVYVACKQGWLGVRAWCVGWVGTLCANKDSWASGCIQELHKYTPVGEASIYEDLSTMGG